MPKYRRAVTPEDLEEQAELEAQQKELEEKETEEKEEKEKEEFLEMSHEEQTFKKRYGDLRAHSQRMEAEFKQKIENLEHQLQNAIKSQTELRDIASPEDAKEWASKYPEIAKIVRYIAYEENKGTKEELSKDKEELNRLRSDIDRQRAYAKLLELHPDFESLRAKQEFHDWIEAKGGWVYKALRESTDPFQAADAVTLYKTTMLKKSEEEIEAEKKKAKAKKDKENGAAESVTRKAKSDSPRSSDKDITWSESYIEEMSVKDHKFFDRHEDEIMEAIKSGKFEYDITQPSA